VSGVGMGDIKEQLNKFISSKKEHVFLNIFLNEIFETILHLHAHTQPLSKLRLSNVLLSQIVFDDMCKSLLRLCINVCGLELNSAKQRGYLKGETSSERFDHFASELLKNENRQGILDKYPLLKQKSQFIITHFIHSTEEFFTQLDRDYEALTNTFFSNDKLIVLNNVNSAGDKHNKGRSTKILSFKTQDDQTKKCIYKPHSLNSDLAFKSFIQWVSNHSTLQFHTYKIIDRQTYGWCEFVTYDACDNHEQLKKYYERLGGLLAITYLLSGHDLHLENIIAHGEYPVIIDHECFCRPLVSFKKNKILKVRPLVNGSLILPHKLGVTEKYQGFDLSAFSGTSNQEAPQKVSKWTEIGTDNMVVKKVKAHSFGGENIPQINSQDAKFLNYINNFKDGFESLYKFFCSHRNLLLSDDSPIQAFEKSEIRVLFRSTDTYGQIIKNSYHPKLLYSKDEHDKYILDNLKNTNIRQIPLETLAEEIHSIFCTDVPYFYTQANSHKIYCNTKIQEKVYVLKSGIDVVKETISLMGRKDLLLQKQLVDNAFRCIKNEFALPQHILTEKVDYFYQPNNLIELASKYINHIDQLIIDTGENYRWPTLTFKGDYICESFTQNDLYSGILGCLLLYLQAGIYIDKKYHLFAQNLLNQYIKHLDEDKYKDDNIGAYSSIGGGLFALIESYKILNNKNILKYIEQLIALGKDKVESDKIFDIIGGSAGFLLQLLKLTKHLSDNQNLEDTIRLCVQHLLQKYIPQDEKGNYLFDKTNPLIGYAHGTAGVGHALVEYYKYSKDNSVLPWLKQALAYEKRLTVNLGDSVWMDPKGEDKYRWRMNSSWCHGTVGIGLSKIFLNRILPNQNVSESIDFALKNTTVERLLKSKRNICHGYIGGSELYIQAYNNNLISKEEYSNNINKIVSTTQQNESEYSHLNLMLGEVGTAYQLLRIAHPNHVPSVLC